MARSKNPNREKAFDIYKSHKGNIKLSEIAEILSENPSNIRSWKKIDNWEENLPKVGAPKGNKNAKGNKGNKNFKGAPKGNINAIRHGLYMSDESFIDKMKGILPKSLINTMKVLSDESPLDKLYRNIMILDAKIANSHKILEVKSKKDHTVIRKKSYLDSNMDEIEEFEIQTAQDKESSYSKSISNMKNTLNNMIKTYVNLLDQDSGLAKEEKLLKIEKLKMDIKSMDNKKDSIPTIVFTGEDNLED